MSASRYKKRSRLTSTCYFFVRGWAHHVVSSSHDLTLIVRTPLFAIGANGSFGRCAVSGKH